MHRHQLAIAIGIALVLSQSTIWAASVTLQSTTPGTADTGNFNITGTGLIGSKLGVGGVSAPQVSGHFQGSVAIDPDAAFTSGGPFGPLLIWRNDVNPVAGEAGGLYVNVASSMTATPGAGATVAGVLRVSNENNRTDLYGLNVLAIQAGGCTPEQGCGQGFVRAAEFDVANTLNTSTDPFDGSAFRTNGIEIINSKDSAHPPAAAIMVWNDCNSIGSCTSSEVSNKWWAEGLALSRISTNGIHFYQNPGGGSDAGNAFGNVAAVNYFSPSPTI